MSVEDTKQHVQRIRQEKLGFPDGTKQPNAFERDLCAPKRTILEVYAAFAEAMKSGQAYQTRLDPPPADPRSCHQAESK